MTLKVHISRIVVDADALPADAGDLRDAAAAAIAARLTGADPAPESLADRVADAVATQVRGVTGHG